MSSHPIPQFSPDALRTQRQKQSVSRTSLAAAIGVSMDTIVNWEQGRNMPRVDLLSAACVVLDCSIADLMTGAEVATCPAP